MGTGSFVFGLKDIRNKREIAGGKAANLGALAGIEGINVPDGFFVSTEAFKRIISEKPLSELINKLSQLKAGDRDKISLLSNDIRNAIEAAAIPQDITNEAAEHLAKLGEEDAYAVRSSATAEDLPEFSFAGQQDTYLNIIGKEAILKHICKCWASLFTDRAVMYRMQNGFGHSEVYLSVIIQKLIFPQVAGILFTADPVTGNRKVVSIDASFGLGEAMASGIVNADVYKVCNDKIIDQRVSSKKLAVYPLKDGGTKEQEIKPDQQNKQALTDEQILQLGRIGRKIEAHFGCPQDIEWCFADGTFYIVQSRPITTLFPPPEASDQEPHVYVSVGHQQMMTNAMKPLGISLWQLTAFRPMFKAGGRLFVDITQQLASPLQRKMVIDVLGEHDPLIKDALITIMERGDIIKTPPEQEGPDSINSSTGKSAADILSQIENDPAIVSELISQSQAAVEDLKQRIEAKSGTEVLDWIIEDIGRL